MNRDEFEIFSNALIKEKVLPILQDGYKNLLRNADQHGKDFYKNAESFASFKEDGRGLVSKGEIEAEKIIRAEFYAKFDHLRIFGEELGDEDNTEKPYTLVIDPVDGTSAMVESVISDDKDRYGFGITLGLMQENNFLGGIIYELKIEGKSLIRGDIWSGWQGENVHLNGEIFNPVEGHKEIKTLYSSSPEVMFRTPEQRSAFHTLEKTAGETKTARNCMAYCEILTQSGGCVIETDLSIHDISAIVPIIKNAGYKITDLNGNDVVFKGAQSEYWLLAAAPELHAKVLDLYNKALQEQPIEIEKSSALNEKTLNTVKF